MTAALELITTHAGVVALEPAWRRLFEIDVTATAQQHYDYVVRGSALRDDGAEPACFVVRMAGEVVGILPLAIAKRRHGLVVLRVIRPMAQPRITAFDALVAPSIATTVLPLLSRGLSELVATVDELDLRFVREDSWLAAMLSSRDTSVKLEPTPEGTVQINFDSNLTSWEQLVPRNTRTDIRRLRRQLVGAIAPYFGSIPPGPTFEPLCRQLLELYAQRTKARGWSDSFAVGRLREGFPALLQQMALDGAATLYGIVHQERLIAGQIVLRAHGFAHSFKIAFDPEWARYGPGAMLHAVVIQDCIERRDHTFDFGHDRDAYKLRWANQFHKNYRLFFARSTTRYQLARSYSRIMRNLARRRPSPPGQ
jgi:CelD/BcsL family acetyltransferase involved in cellulose biosynthesis